MKGYFMNSLVVISVYYILYTTWTIHSPKYLSTIAPLVAQSVKNLSAIQETWVPVMQETWVQSLGWEDPLVEGMTTHSSILAQRIPMERRG